MAHSDRMTYALWTPTSAAGYGLRGHQMCSALACTDEELNGILARLAPLPTGKGEPVLSLTDKAIRSSLKGMRAMPPRRDGGRAWPSPYVIHALELDPNLSERLERALIAQESRQATNSHSLRPRAHTARSTKSSPRPSKTGLVPILYRAQQTLSPRRVLSTRSPSKRLTTMPTSSRGTSRKMRSGDIAWTASAMLNSPMSPSAVADRATSPSKTISHRRAPS